MANARHPLSFAEMAKARQRLEIEAIARELRRPIAEVAELYVDLDTELRRNARVTDFVAVLVARKVRARYRTDSSSTAQPT